MCYLPKQNTMKKFYLLAVATFISVTIFAKVDTVLVKNFQFVPASFNAHIGDTVRWIWVEGAHTTTSTSVPIGAKAWDDSLNNLNKKNKKFSYIIKKKGTYSYFCKIHGAFMSASFTVTKPVNGFGDFSIENAANGKPDLKWNVVPENDIKYFSVQKSVDGKNFSEIGVINANNSLKYTYTDNTTATGKFIYYQVAFTNSKGEKDISNRILFTQNESATKIITSITPNPVTKPGHLMLQFNADAEGTMLAKLFNENGTLVLWDEFAATKGVNYGHFHLGNITPGTYYLICSMGTLKEKHIVLVK